MNSIPLIGYSINNMYFKGIQAGIQASHSMVELGQDVQCNFLHQRTIGRLTFTGKSLYDDWARNHKTMMVLNGGNKSSMLDLLNLLHKSSFPYAKFYEVDVSDDCLSSISLIAPMAKEVIKNPFLERLFSDVDYAVIELLSKMRFAS